MRTHPIDSTMQAPIFGPSTMPVVDIKSELRLQIERSLLALVYRDSRQALQLRVPERQRSA
jgi:hypothetical protein